MKIYDIIIVGAGPAGLYLAHRLEAETRSVSSFRILILEKERWIGGRTRQEWFDRTWINTGAGVGRLRKDRRLLRLVQDFIFQGKQRTEEKTRGTTRLQTFAAPVCFDFPPPEHDLSYFLQILQAHRPWIAEHRHSLSFKQCFLHFFSKREYRQFCHLNGYTDFERADPLDTLDDYGFDDNLPSRKENEQKFFQVPWNRLMHALRSSLQKTTVRFRTCVTGFAREGPSLFRVSVEKMTTFSASSSLLPSSSFLGRHIIFAGCVDHYPFPLVQRGIGCNSFIRVYLSSPLLSSSSSSSSSSFPSCVHYTSTLLQKTRQLTPSLMMLAYADNHNADRIAAMDPSALLLLLLLSTSISSPLSEIRDHHRIRLFYRKCGTHFYFPLDPSFQDRDQFIDYAQHPEPGVFLVGEVISKNQGWTEGALESVDRILPRLLRSIDLARATPSSLEKKKCPY